MSNHSKPISLTASRNRWEAARICVLGTTSALANVIRSRGSGVKERHTPNGRLDVV